MLQALILLEASELLCHLQHCVLSALSTQPPAQSGLSSPAHVAGTCCCCVCVKQLPCFSWPSVIQSGGTWYKDQAVAQPDAVTYWVDLFISGGMADESCKQSRGISDFLGWKMLLLCSALLGGTIADVAPPRGRVLAGPQCFGALFLLASHWCTQAGLVPSFCPWFGVQGRHLIWVEAQGDCTQC